MPTDRQRLAHRLVRRHGVNHRDWLEAQIVEREASRIVDGLTDQQVAHYLRRIA